MEVDSGDPSSVNKNPKVIKGAQDDAAKLDILVCGTCRNVFHFIEEFREHKQEACPTSTFNAQETKPQVWAFLLWKSAIVNKERGDGGPGTINSWKMYQRWCKMDGEIRENWITAGKALQSYSMIGNAKLQEVRNNNEGKTHQTNNQSGEEGESKDEMHGGSKSNQKKIVSRPENVEKANSDAIKSDNWNNVSSEDSTIKKNVSNSSIINKSIIGDDLDKENFEGKKMNRILRGEDDSSKKIIEENDDTIEIKEEKLSEEEEGSRGAWDVEDMDESTEILSAPAEPPIAKKRNEPRPGSNKVTRRSLNRSQNDGSSEDEYVVEKILAKRFNPKKKYYEYLLKWEGYPHEQNTWEPVHNMAACDKLVETFERNLAKQKAAQQAQQAQLHSQKIVANTQSISRKMVGARENRSEAGPGPSGMESGRPVRSSKKKALEQVKSWCGSMAKTTEFGKRKVGESSDSDSDDDDDIPEKKVKLEPPDDDDWSSGDLQCSPSSSGEDNAVAIQGTQSKVVGVIHKSKEQLFAPVVKRSPGRPRKMRADETSIINGMKSRKEDANELAIKLGLESDSSPESKVRSSQGNKVSGQPPVLVANSKGVIKVDPRQVPNLTSGVYIVANKPNVVKLESLPGSPPKGKVLTSKSLSTKLGEGPVKSGLTSGIIRKTGAVLAGGPTRLRPLAPAPSPVKLLPKPSANPLAGVLLGGPGLMKVAPQLGQRTVVSARPRTAASSPRILGPRPTAILQPRSTVLQSSIRPANPTVAGMKRPIGIPGIQTKITTAVRPRIPSAAKIVSPLTAQTKSGMKPIQAMLGKAVQGQNLATSGLLASKKNSEGVLKPGERLTVATVKSGVRIEEEKPRKLIGRGRGRGSILAVGNDPLGKPRDSKLSESDSLHMEFHEVTTSESESGDSLPDLPMGDLPSLEPESPPRPFTLCPETGKILSRAEGEPSPPPSPIQPPSTSAPTPTSAPVPTSGPTPTQASDRASDPAPGANESEEILPDKRESSPIQYSENNETLLKVEMSPGGTTGTVIESSVADSQYVDTLRTEQGVTVTKISAELGTKSAEQNMNTVPRATSPMAGKAGGGISVPARKLFMEGNKMNTTEVVTVTGEDGVVYQIATEGQEGIEEGEGMQQCVYVTTDQAEGSEEGAVLTLDTAVAEAVAQLMPDQVNVIGGGCSQFYIKEGEENPVTEDNNEQLVMTSVVDQPNSDDNAQVVAHVVQEGEIIPGTGKRRVVLLLPDGNLMMTDVDEEQYAALNLDK